MATTWLGATAGQPPLAQQVNQLLTTHPTTYVYTGLSVASQSTAGSGSVNSDGLYVAQSFTTGASTAAVGRFAFEMSVTGLPGPLTVQLQSSSGSAPSGTVLASTTIPAQWVASSPAYVSVPLPATVSASTTYWIVAGAVGDASDYYSFAKSNQASGASTSSTGSTWTAQSYGLLYAVYDQSVVLPLLHTWEDSGARATTWTTNAQSQITALEEYTVGQGSAQYMASNRTLTYSGVFLESVA